jgi:hypothetical protein
LPSYSALRVARPLVASNTTRFSERKASPPSRTCARGQTRLDLALFGVDGDDLRGAEILGAEDAASDRRVIGKRHVLGPDAKRQLSTDAILMDLRHGDPGAVEPDRALAALQRTLESDEVHRRRTDKAGDEHARRLVVHLLRVADLLDDAVVHHRDLVGHRHCLDLIVSHVDRRRPDTVMQIAQLSAHQVAELGVKRAERFVHEKRLGPPHDGAAKRDALAVAAGQL